MSVLYPPLAPAGEPAVFLDWRGPGHYASRPRPCDSCGNPTQLRNDAGQPQHKTCAESELEQLWKEGR